jgi:hypothetical protein
MLTLISVITSAAVAAFATVGLVQYIKQLWTTAPNWVWKVALPVLGALIFVLLVLLPSQATLWILGFVLVVAVGQLFYEVFVKLFNKLKDWIASLVK